MKIAIVADTHLQDTNFSQGRFADLITSIIESDNEYKFVWFIGDLLHKNTISTTLVLFLKEQVQRLIDSKVIPQYIEGNHERVNKHEYLITSLVSKLVPIKKLPMRFKILNTNIEAYGHDQLDILTKSTGRSHILLSHFRWDTPLYKGELSKEELRGITKRYQTVILGDIHEEYEPKKNVKYINSPYNIKYGKLVKRGYMCLTIEDNSYSIERVHLGLSNRLVVNTTVTELPQILDHIKEDSLNTYKVKINITSDEDVVNIRNYKLVGDNYFIDYEFVENDTIVNPATELVGIREAFEDALTDPDTKQYVMKLIDQEV